eukprot:TRINITY_DN525_c0_g1_i1.p1 TRINITY_DN525_c0_g1~~TRINITY_DN525_c0_g1_i1.p1  ORF type:complete len:315 (+),score=30.26 TRINITY_DN525_c0_g1_i1:254-1198(+)
MPLMTTQSKKQVLITEQLDKASTGKKLNTAECRETIGRLVEKLYKGAMSDLRAVWKMAGRRIAKAYREKYKRRPPILGYKYMDILKRKVKKRAYGYVVTNDEWILDQVMGCVEKYNSNYQKKKAKQKEAKKQKERQEKITKYIHVTEGLNDSDEKEDSKQNKGERNLEDEPMELVSPRTKSIAELKESIASLQEKLKQEQCQARNQFTIHSCDRSVNFIYQFALRVSFKGQLPGTAYDNLELSLQKASTVYSSQISKLCNINIGYLIVLWLNQTRSIIGFLLQCQKCSGFIIELVLLKIALLLSVNLPIEYGLI